MADNDTVKLGNARLALKAPDSLVAREEVIALCGHGVTPIAIAAALGICSAQVQKVCGVTFESAGYDVARLGATVFDALSGAPNMVPREEIYAAGAAALRLLTTSSVTEAEVKEATSFFGAPAEETT